MLPVNINTWQDKKHGINTSINSILTPKQVQNCWSPAHPWEKKVPLVDKEKRTLPLAGIKLEDTNPSTNLQVVWLKVMVPDTTSVAKSNALAKMVHHDLHAQYQQVHQQRISQSNTVGTFKQTPRVRDLGNERQKTKMSGSMKGIPWWCVQAQQIRTGLHLPLVPFTLQTRNITARTANNKWITITPDTKPATS